MVDPIMSDHLGNLMLRLKRQLHLTSIVVTHDLDLMRKVADKVVFLFRRTSYLLRNGGGVEQIRSSAYPGVSGDGSRGAVEHTKRLISCLPQTAANK